MPRGSNQRKPYAPEFRREAVELYRRGGRPLREIASDVEVSSESLRLWVKQAKVEAGEQAGLSSEERAELRELRRKVRVLEQEREILKEVVMAAAWRRPPVWDENRLAVGLTPLLLAAASA